MNKPEVPVSARRAGFIFIFITVLLDMLAIGMIIPVLPKLVVDFVTGDTARAAAIYGLFGTVWALMQFLFSPIQGALSDRLGRRPVILASNIGLGLDYILMALAPNLYWLFVGRLISGITSASIATSFAYIADVTEPDQRAARYGLLGAAFGVGFVIGPALGGVLGAVDPRLPFWAAAAFSLANAVYGLFVLPESLTPDRRAPFLWRRANPVGSLALLRSHPDLFGLAMVNFLYNLAHVVLPSVAVIYMGYRYGWDARAVGFVLAFVGLCAMVVQAGLVGWSVAKIGERKTLLLGLMFGAAGFSLYGLASTGEFFLAGVPLMSLWGLAGSALQSLMTRRVNEFEQGQLQGANASLQGIANLAGPFLFTLTFAYSINPAHPVHIPGAPFLLAALLRALSLWLAWSVTRER